MTDRLFAPDGPALSPREARALRRVNEAAASPLFELAELDAGACPACGGSPTACTCSRTGAEPVALELEPTEPDPEGDTDR